MLQLSAAAKPVMADPPLPIILSDSGEALQTTKHSHVCTQDVDAEYDFRPVTDYNLNIKKFLEVF